MKHIISIITTYLGCTFINLTSPIILNRYSGSL
nr:MAG TPA: hypothetical protein [Caudoviricetes sp.]